MFYQMPRIFFPGGALFSRLCIRFDYSGHRESYIHQSRRGGLRCGYHQVQPRRDHPVAREQRAKASSPVARLSG